RVGVGGRKVSRRWRRAKCDRKDLLQELRTERRQRDSDDLRLLWASDQDQNMYQHGRLLREPRTRNYSRLAGLRQRFIQRAVLRVQRLEAQFLPPDVRGTRSKSNCRPMQRDRSLLR